MAATRATQPPPRGPKAGWRRQLPWRRDKRDRRGSRPGTDAAYERSEAAEQERLIIEALGDLGDMDVREVMTPRLDVVALNIPVSAQDVARAVRESGHSCFPVVNDGLDDVVGVLYVNDLFRSRRATRADLFGAGATDAAAVGAAAGGAAAGGAAATDAAAGLSTVEISRRIRQPYIVPESRPILAALVEMRRHHRSFAVVVDEHGGVSGVLTVKDLLEPIVGDLHDELDQEEPPSIVRVDGSRWLVDGRTNVDEVRERLGIDVPEGEYVTISGYLLDVLGHIPEEGETTSLDGWELTVQDMDKRRIAAVLVRRPETASGDREDRQGSDVPAGHTAPEASPQAAASSDTSQRRVTGSPSDASGGAPASSSDEERPGGGEHRGGG